MGLAFRVGHWEVVAYGWANAAMCGGGAHFGWVGRAYFHVDTEQRLESGGEGSQLVALLQPGNWYRVLRAESAVVRARDERGNEGRVPADAVHPE